MRRRTAIGLIALGGASAMATRFAVRRAGPGARRAPAIWVPRFAPPPKIPPVLDPTTRTETQDEYDIVQREAEQEIPPGYTTKIWGYEGCFPGLTIRVRRNRTAVVRQTNRLPTHTVVHLHGGVTPPDSDGFATDMVRPGVADVHVSKPPARLHALVPRSRHGSHGREHLSRPCRFLHHRG